MHHQVVGYHNIRFIAVVFSFWSLRVLLFVIVGGREKEKQREIYAGFCFLLSLHSSAEYHTGVVHTTENVFSARK